MFRLTRTAFSLSRLASSSLPVGKFNNVYNRQPLIRYFCTPSPPVPKKESMYQRFKTMAKEYWYVVIPVHCGTSLVWIGVFYQVAKRYEDGVDIKAVLKWFGISENITEKVVSSGAGNLALTYALYKVATPARYTVTLGCSMYAINYLKKRGYVTAKEGLAKMSKHAKDLSNKHRENKLAKSASSSKPPPSSGKPS